jgi:uncharacterized protein YktA (UPF0223 family)
MIKIMEIIMKTIEEYKKIIELAKDGYSYSYISKLLNISRFTIRDTVENPELTLQKASEKKDVFPSVEEIKSVIPNLSSLAQVLTKFNLSNSGNAYRTLKKIIKENNIDVSHFTGQAHGSTVKKLIESNTIPIESILIEKSTYQTSKLSKRLKQEGLLEYKCYGPRCKIIDTWNDEPIVLHLDHINGVHNDHRLENLRYLCPNCHSQTSTYCGRNAKKTLHNIKVRQPNSNKKEYFCNKCSSPVKNSNSKQCRACAYKAQFKANYPEPEKLIAMIKENGYVKVAESLGVSDNAVRHHLKTRGYELT